MLSEIFLHFPQNTFFSLDVFRLFLLGLQQREISQHDTSLRKHHVFPDIMVLLTYYRQECPHSLTLLESDGKKKSGPNEYLNLEPDIKQKDEMNVHWSD